MGHPLRDGWNGRTRERSRPQVRRTRWNTCPERAGGQDSDYGWERGHAKGAILQAKSQRVITEDGRTFESDLVVSNADYATTYMKMIRPKYRTWNPDWKVKAMRYSMSLVVIYFGFKKREGEEIDLQHHNIILGPRYEALLSDIFDRKILADDFSQYLHIPTLTDHSLAPEGHHACYTLIPVPNKAGQTNWAEEGDAFVDTILRFLDERGYIPDLKDASRPCRRDTRLF